MNAGNQSKARGAPHSSAMQVSRNAAMGPAFVLPFGLGPHAVSALSGRLANSWAICGDALRASIRMRLQRIS